jgi:hypothetical protein
MEMNIVGMLMYKKMVIFMAEYGINEVRVQ